MPNAFGVEHVISKADKKINGSTARVSSAGGLLPGKTYRQIRSKKGSNFRYDPKENGKTNAAAGAVAGASVGAASGAQLGLIAADGKNKSKNDKLHNLRMESLRHGRDENLEYERQHREWMSSQSKSPSSIPKEYARAHKAYTLAQKASTPGEKQAAQQAFRRMAEKQGGEQKLSDLFVQAEKKPEKSAPFKFDPLKNSDPRHAASKAKRAKLASEILRSEKKFTRGGIVAGAIAGGAAFGAANYFSGKQQRSQYNKWTENLHPRGQGGKFSSK